MKIGEIFFSWLFANFSVLKTSFHTYYSCFFILMSLLIICNDIFKKLIIEKLNYCHMISWINTLFIKKLTIYNILQWHSYATINFDNVFAHCLFVITINLFNNGNLSGKWVPERIRFILTKSGYSSMSFLCSNYLKWANRRALTLSLKYFCQKCFTSCTNMNWYKKYLYSSCRLFIHKCTYLWL